MKIKNITPYKSLNLKKGDVIFGEPEFVNGKYTDVNREVTEVGFTNESDCDTKTDYIERMPSKHKLFTFKNTTNLKNIDSSRKNGIWIIEDVAHIKEFQGLHGLLPEKLTITARLVEDNTLTDKVIKFNTIGGESTIDKEFEIIAKIV